MVNGIEIVNNMSGKEVESRRNGGEEGWGREGSPLSLVFLGRKERKREIIEKYKFLLPLCPKLNGST
jgi:hypothetical protein